MVLPRPTPGFAILRDSVAFYAAAVDTCRIDGERVVPQPGGFYGGWITADIADPLKGRARQRLLASAPLVTPDGRYIVVRGRLWRRSDPRPAEP